MSAFSGEGLAGFGAAMRGLVEEQAVPGVVALLARGDEVHTEVHGVTDIVSGAPLREDAIFRIQSMTKPIQAVATMQLVERGLLPLDDPVERWLPELANRVVLRDPGSELDDVVPARRPITVDHLLTCRSGYGSIFPDPASPIARAMAERVMDPNPVPTLVASNDFLARLAELPLVHQPGEGWRYHTSFDILGILLSRVTGTSLNEHLRASIFEPLGMTDTSLFVPAEKHHRLPAVYQRDDVTGQLVEIEPAGGGYHTEAPSFDVSHGELASTVRDYHRFAAMLMRGGELDGVRLLDEASVATMLRDHIDPGQKDPESFFPGFWEESSWGYGMGVTVVRDAFGDAGRYGWIGGYGTAWFNDPNIGLTGIMMSQVQMDSRSMEVTGAFYRAAYAALAWPERR